MPPVMDQFVNTAYDVTSQLFGPDSGIPWWAWGLVLVALVTAPGLGGVLWQWRAAIVARHDAERANGQAKIQTAPTTARL